MNAEAFRLALPDAVRDRLPRELQTFRHANRFGIVPFWYGEPMFHYEISTHARLEVIEVGLHLEHKDSKRNTALYQHFDRYFIEIRAMLGDVWLEQWDKGWHKLYGTLPLVKYDDTLLEAVSHEMAQQIVVLQPILRDGIALLANTFSTKSTTAKGKR
jgi:hypothetical protein